MSRPNIEDLLDRYFNRQTTDEEKELVFGIALQAKNLDQILKIICAFNNASYNRNQNGNIIIEGQGCNYLNHFTYKTITINSTN